MSASIFHRFPRLARDVRRDVPYHMSAARAKWELERIGRSSRPIVVGPWLSEIGFELLYWIPMLLRFRLRHGIERDQMIAVSRGGVATWYEGVCGSYVEIFDQLSPAELREWQTELVAERGSQKQMGLSTLDAEILRRIADQLGTDNFELLHPSLMYNRFRVVWLRRRPVSLIQREVGYRPLPRRGDVPHAALELPEKYVAVKAYFSDCLPDTDENRRFFRELLARLSEKNNVVLLSTNLEVDDHLDFPAEHAERLYVPSQFMTPQDNLWVQTQIIRRAQALFATYGGFSYLGPFLGVSSLSFYSDDNFNAIHLDVMRRAVQKLRAERKVGDADFATLRIQDLRLVDMLAGGKRAGGTSLEQAVSTGKREPSADPARA